MNNQDVLDELIVPQIYKLIKHFIQAGAEQEEYMKFYFSPDLIIPSLNTL